MFRFDGKIRRAHRVSFLLNVGEIPEGMSVLHSCDNPPCVNPRHLRLGTQQDNMDDRMERDGYRSVAKGEANGFSKFTREQVIEIRDRHARGGVTQRTLAKEYGMSQAQVSKIILRQAWASIPARGA